MIEFPNITNDLKEKALVKLIADQTNEIRKAFKRIEYLLNLSISKTGFFELFSQVLT
jgi:hypothetical protein